MHTFDLSSFEQARLIRLAENLLDSEVRTVTAAVNPRSPGGPHDYSSDADYWWPDPENPDGPYIHRDGLSNPDNFSAHRETMRDFARVFGALAAAWRVTGDARYSRAAEKHLAAWFVNPGTRMNPNLQYAQAIRNKCTGRGIGIIDTLHLAEVALGAHILAERGALDAECVKGTRRWFAEYLDWICTHPYGIAERDMKNNHGSCWALQAAAFAILAGDAACLADCRRRLLEVFLPNQMAVDGSFPEELRRTKSYAYSLFNLDVLSALAVIASRPGENLMSHTLPDGRGLVRGVLFMAPFVKDKRLWINAPDLMYWHEWPVRHPSLLFGALADGTMEWLELWKSLEADPAVPEIRRNFPIRNPILWIR